MNTPRPPASDIPSEQDLALAFDLYKSIYSGEYTVVRAAARIKAHTQAELAELRQHTEAMADALAVAETAIRRVINEDDDGNGFTSGTFSGLADALQAINKTKDGTR